MTARIKIRRDSAASWTNNNPILAAGELGLDTDANQIKVGDGTTAWADLEYASGGGFDGTSDLVFQTEDVGFYALGLPQYEWGWATFASVTMDSAATGNTAKTVYGIGRYYDQDDDRQKMFVNKRNADDTTAWTVSLVHSGGGWNVDPWNITFDAATDKLYASGQSFDNNDGAYFAWILELDTSNGAILSQLKLTAPNSNYPYIYDLLVDPDTGDFVAVGSVAKQPDRQAVTPLDAVLVNPVQSWSTNGQEFDPDFSLLVFAATDFASKGYYPDNLSEWRLYDHTNAGDSGQNCNRINEFRNLDTVTQTGTGAGATVNLKYSIADNGQSKWTFADWAGNDGNPTWTYAVGDTVKVVGSAFGGTDGVDDITLTIRQAQNGGQNYLEFVNPQDQQGVPTPPTVVTDYVRIWMYGSYNFADATNDATVWDIARQEFDSGFILTANDQLLLNTGGYSDKIVSGDVYNDGTDSYVYAVGRIEANDPATDGNRCVVYKIKITDGTQTWGKAIDMMVVPTSGYGNGDYPKSLTCDNSGNVYVSSTGYDDVGNYGDIITKLDATGAITWQVKVDPGTGDWSNDPKLDYDLDNDKLYLGGDSGVGMRLVEINPATGATNWARSIDFTNANYQFNISDGDWQFFAAGSGRIALAGYANDYPGTYNGGEDFGVLVGLDAGMITVSTDEVGTSGPFTLSVDSYHTTGGTGAGVSRTITNDKYDLEAGTLITSASTSLLGSSNNAININSSDLTRSPYKIENVKSITFADGTVQSSAAQGVKHKWKNPNSNTWKVVEWNEGKAVRYNQYQGTSQQTFTAKTSASGVNFVPLNIQTSSLDWINFWNINNKPNLRVNVNGTTYNWNGYGSDDTGYVTVQLEVLPGQQLPTFSFNDTIILIWDEPQSLSPVIWFDPSNSPYGDNQFRGAIIHYHAYSDNVGGTIVGTIHYAYDCGETEQATHTEHFAGNSDGQFMNFWNVDSNGRLSYTNSIYNEDYVFIQWTATMFYGSEYNC